MKLYRLKDFLLLPRGTVYSSYIPCVLSDLYIKGDSIKDFDFFTTDLIDCLKNTGSEDNQSKHEMLQIGKNIPLDHDTGSRDGMFDEERLFAVYDTQDIKGLINTLTEALEQQDK